ncbi:heptaprenyl diphosphate synthase component 1 [Alkalihalobacillus sp. BA299]|uniref:heptaprenyl diphosphate synthase component 1 n=1 Tax=Alkalihalobacillus sp. BA299 TaxID=2815938 RepID=UPI001ADC24D3|nr:heptaprenyl diphosphate synthase component 1 [Alkalihalobacillus sp. BA299]
MNDLNEHVNECKKKFFSITKHTFLQKYVQKPIIDEDKLRFIYAMLSERVPLKDIKVYALSAILVDAALNTHEKVSLNKINSDYVKKNRQLTVLAGDYFCSLYYSLLAEAGKISMIRMYSLSIQEINEYKMNIYQNEDLSFAEIREDISSIESVLLQNLAEHFKLPHWKKIIAEFFFLKRMLFERDQWFEGKKLSILRALLNDQKEKTYQQTKLKDDEILEILNHRISEGKERIEKYLEDPLFQQEFILKQMERLFSPINYSEKVAEEG